MKNKKLHIDEIVDLMQDGLEKPVTKIIKGKKHCILDGDYITLEAEPIYGDRAFIVNGEEDEPSYWVEVKRIEF